MKDTTLLKRISMDPKVMLGKPVIKGTRLTVELILEKLAYGATYEDLIADYSFLKVEDIRASVLYASRAMAVEEIVAA
jgi:uncharacterized protein (DUF433 family)